MEPTNNEETPTKQAPNEVQMRNKTPATTPKNFARFLLLSNNQSFTPSPSSMSQRVVRNPFENQLHERLHLPLISSPSLFHTLATPKRRSSFNHNSQEFEWTIEELSSLNPVNVVPHETQFREVLDPIREAQAQAAINSFFTEQKIVPSPQVCSLRSQKIILKDERISLKIVNSTALISNNLLSAEHQQIHRPERSDVASQTALTFPPKLPKEVEDLLKRYQFFDDEDANESLDKNNSMMDISTLRRKLFIQRPESPEPDDYKDESFGVHLSPPPRTPELTTGCDENNAVNSANLKANDSFGSDMFGELSPIRKCSSPQLNSNDISMMSECGQEKTPSRGYFSRKKKGKNLSESFCLLQNGDDEFDDMGKENTIKEPKRFARFDSGFAADEDSKLSAENMQF